MSLVTGGLGVGGGLVTSGLAGVSWWTLVGARIQRVIWTTTKKIQVFCLVVKQEFTGNK